MGKGLHLFHVLLLKVSFKGRGLFTLLLVSPLVIGLFNFIGLVEQALSEIRQSGGELEVTKEEKAGFSDLPHFHAWAPI